MMKWFHRPKESPEPAQTPAAPERLSAIAARSDTDKISYARIYETYLDPIRERPLRFLEIGIGGYRDPKAGGASLRMWREYLPNALIHGLDLHDKSSHAEPRIRIHQGSQDDPAVLDRIADDMGRIDIVVDDGSHFSAHVRFTFEHLFPKLAPGGLYFIEDLGTSYWPTHGGSPDPADPSTSMYFLKTIPDRLNSFAFKHEYTPGYLDKNVETIHFYPNMAVIRKTMTPRR
ncbi:MAG: class I SAM-dependent methyltransferase [Rhizobiales bacterium]|nr:class I SAM-dependent methyltransferase [Hyphomicrobiales bacterium]